MELVINSPKDSDPSIAATSALFPIREVKVTDKDSSGPDFKELADSIRSVFSDETLPTDFKISVLKGVSALMGRSVDTSDAFAQMIENLESLNVRDNENREKASKNAIFKPFSKSGVNVSNQDIKSDEIFRKPTTGVKITSENVFDDEEDEDLITSNSLE